MCADSPTLSEFQLKVMACETAWARDISSGADRAMEAQRRLPRDAGDAETRERSDWWRAGILGPDWSVPLFSDGG